MSSARTLVAVAALVGPSLGLSEEMRTDTSASSLRVRVGKAGVLSVLGHDHDFTPERWRADVSFDPARPQDLHVDIAVEAGSLHDQERDLSRKNRATVDRQTAGPEVLDAKRFPEIRYRGAALEVHAAADGNLEGVVRGTLALHGVARPLDVPFRVRPGAGGYLATGAVGFRQSEFGIKPYSTAMGTIAVRDEVRIEFELAVPSRAPGSAATSAGSRRGVAATSGE